jgi:hypothetical protein
LPACRAIKRIRSETQGGSLHYMHVDLASLKSVRAFAEAFLARGLPLHCLINNAGLGLPHEAHTEDGFETTIGVNFYSHLLLTHLLLPQLKHSTPSRQAGRAAVQTCWRDWVTAGRIQAVLLLSCLTCWRCRAARNTLPALPCALRVGAGWCSSPPLRTARLKMLHHACRLSFQPMPAVQGGVHVLP